jgi:GDP-L-fucose synthase
MIDLVAGLGMIGSNVMRILESDRKTSVVAADFRNGYDLRNPSDCARAVDGVERVFHLADRTVGIGYSSTHHGQMLTDSLLISLNLLEAARKAGVKDYLYVSSSCVYEDVWYRQGIIEEQGCPSEVYGKIGTPEKANEGYGWAKRIAELQCQYYSKEYGMRIVIARPANVYGPSYYWQRLVEDMHFIPALISKMVRGDKEIVVWGSGKQTRTFQYEADTAKLIVDLMDKGESGEAYNLGGFEMSIKDWVDCLWTATGWSGKLTFDTSKPEGPKRKAQDTSKIFNLLGTGPVSKNGLLITVGAARKALCSSAR